VKAQIIRLFTLSFSPSCDCLSLRSKYSIQHHFSVILYWCFLSLTWTSKFHTHIKHFRTLIKFDFRLVWRRGYIGLIGPKLNSPHNLQCIPHNTNFNRNPYIYRKWNNIQKHRRTNTPPHFRLILCKGPFPFASI